GLVTALSASTITLNGGGAFTQNGTGPVNVGGTITTQNATISHTIPVSVLIPSTFTSNGGDITFFDTVQGPACLTLNAGTGDVIFQAPVGEVTPLGCLTTSAANIFQSVDIVAAGTVQETATGTIHLAGDITTSSGDITLVGSVSIESSSTLTLSGGSGTISSANAINGDIAGRNLTMNAGSGDIA